MLNAITNNVTKGKGEPCDIAAYDAEKCFDSLWAQECINDIWDAGCRDYKLSLLHLENQIAQVVVKTPGWNSEPNTIKSIIMQGGVMGSILKGVPAKTRSPETLNCSKSKTCRARKLKLHQPV